MPLAIISPIIVRTASDINAWGDKPGNEAS